MTEPAAPDTLSLIDTLERVATAPGTGELFDAVRAGDPAVVAAVLGRFPAHPKARLVGEWLRARGVDGPARPSPDAVLAAHGIDDLEAHLLGMQRQLGTVQRSLDAALARAARAETVASAYAAVLVLLVLLALLGWAAAIGVVPLFRPVDVPETQTPPASARPAPPER